MHAVGLANWHETHTHCSKCGAQTVSDLGGSVRVCIKDSTQHHPRTDPAVIVLVRDVADRILLGHQPIWPEKRFSTFAGFVETGESFEECVSREIFEEAGVYPSQVKYITSQPWPFPASIMIAFEAISDRPEDARPDGQEITEVRWLSREEMKQAVASGEILLPPGIKWRAVNSGDVAIVTNKNSHTNDGAELVGGYGIGIASKVAVKHWDRIDLGRSVIGMPLIIPAEGKDGKQKAKPIYVADEPRVALAATLENGWTVINTHLSFVPFVNLYQLRKIKLWAKKLGKQYGTQVLIIGDLNLPKGIPALSSSWNSLITQNTYPSWGAKIQFDYILSNSLKTDQYEALDTVATGISDHLPIRVKIR